MQTPKPLDYEERTGPLPAKAPWKYLPLAVMAALLPFVLVAAAVGIMLLLIKLVTGW